MLGNVLDQLHHCLEFVIPQRRMRLGADDVSFQCTRLCTTNNGTALNESSNVLIVRCLFNHLIFPSGLRSVLPSAGRRATARKSLCVTPQRQARQPASDVVTGRYVPIRRSKFIKRLQMSNFFLCVDNKKNVNPGFQDEHGSDGSNKPQPHPLSKERGWGSEAFSEAEVGVSSPFDAFLVSPKGTFGRRKQANQLILPPSFAVPPCCELCIRR